MRLLLLRVAETGLSVAAIVAVLAFGGAAPPFFLFTQIVVFGLAIFLLAANLRHPRISLRLPRTVPIVLTALVLTQALPFPASLVAVLAPRDILAGEPRFTLSVAPYQTVSHLLLLLTYLTAFSLVLLVCQDRRATRRLVYALVALGVFEAFYGLVQYLTGWQQIFAYVKKYYLEDATGTYINRNHFAGLLEMVLPFALAIALRLADALRRTALRNERPLRAVLYAPELPSLVFWLFVATVIFVALIFSRSRMGFISAVASLIVILALLGTSSLSARIRYVAAGLFFLAVVGLIVWIGTDPVITRFETLGQEYSQSGQNRVSIWRDTLKLIGHHPFLGTGLGTFSVAYTSVQTAFLDLRVDHAHCDYLELVSELGLPGGIFVFGSILWVLAKTLRHYRRADDRYDSAVCLGCVGSIVAILVHSVADFNLYIPANALIFSVVLALAWSTTHNSAQIREIPD